MRMLWLMMLGLSAIVQAAPAHVHGEAKLQAVIDGGNLHIHLESPLEALLGFERAPRSPAEKQTLAAMVTTLQQADTLFVLPAEAGCKALPVVIESAILSDKPVRGQHLDVDVDFRWQCAKVSALRALDTRLFQQFPRLRRITVELIGPTGQKAGQLTPAASRFVW